MSADEPQPAPTAPDRADPQPAASESTFGLDLARAALAEARERARKGPRRTKRAGAPVVRARGDDARDPLLFGAVLDRLVAERGWSAPAAAVGVVDRWPDLVGAEIADRTEAVSLTDGVLVIRAVSTAWATQLRLLAPDILRRLNTELGHGSVTRLDVRGPAAPNWVKGPLRARDSRGPRDTYG